MKFEQLGNEFPPLKQPKNALLFYLEAFSSRSCLAKDNLDSNSSLYSVLSKKIY